LELEIVILREINSFHKDKFTSCNVESSGGRGQKGHENKRGTIMDVEAGVRKSKRKCDYDQNMLYACVEIS
jgi:hypothetical protein